jgi:hypothetical protein
MPSGAAERAISQYERAPSGSEGSGGIGPRPIPELRAENIPALQKKWQPCNTKTLHWDRKAVRNDRNQVAPSLPASGTLDMHNRSLSLATTKQPGS